MCDYGDTEQVWVRITPGLSCTRRAKWKNAVIDRCIAPLVQALQSEGIDMLSSCCGHGKGDGEILLADGRRLVIKQ